MTLYFLLAALVFVTCLVYMIHMLGKYAFTKDFIFCTLMSPLLMSAVVFLWVLSVEYVHYL